MLSVRLLNLDEYREDFSDGIRSNILIMDGESDEEVAIAAAISLDIRGNYSVFLENKTEYLWIGDLFEIIVSRECVTLTPNYFDLEESVQYTIQIKKWEDALNLWKENYLKEMMCSEYFSDKYMKYILGTFILVWDKIIDTRDILNGLVLESMKECACRYGVPLSIIYRSFRRVDARGLTEITVFITRLLRGVEYLDRKHKEGIYFFENDEKNIKRYFEYYCIPTFGYYEYLKELWEFLILNFK